MKIKNDLTRMIGVKYPIIQGAFGVPGTGTSKIAIPVSEAGALGILTTVCYKNPDEFQEDLRNAKRMTEKPFAVNFTLFKDGKYDNNYHKDYMKITLDEGIKIVFTSGYDGSLIGKFFKNAGCTWIHKCATIRHALTISKKGADAVVIVGLEGTGFKSPEQNTTLINMTAARKLINVPLIAAGGIGDARGFVAALAMGASGIYMGTAFTATREYQATEKSKMKIVDQDIRDAEYVKKVLKLGHGAVHSLSSGVINSIPSVNEYIEKIIREAEEVLIQFRDWGMLE